MRRVGFVSLLLRIWKSNKAWQIHCKWCLSFVLLSSHCTKFIMFLKTAAHLKDALFNLIAMLKNLRCCTFFITLSANDQWLPLDWTFKNVTGFFFKSSPFIVKENSLMATIFRKNTLSKHVQLSGEHPLGEVIY